MLISVARRVLCRSLVALGVTALAGCSMFSSPDPRFDPAPLTEYPAGISAHVIWSASIGSGSGSGFGPQVVGDNVYAATPSGSVAKVDLATGTIRWQASAGKSLSAGVGSDGNVTAVAAPDGTVIAFDDKGTEKWRAAASSQVDIPPAVGEGVVVVRSSYYRIQAFDENSGNPLWNVQRPGPALALRTNMRMVIIEGLVISGLPNGRLMAINLHTGAVQWEGTVSVSQGATDLERVSDVVGSPQTQGSLLCAVSYQGKMACFDVSQGGRPLWDKPFSSATGMVTDSQQAYASNQRGVVYAFRLADGSQVWKQDALLNRSLSGPAVIPQALAVGDYQGYVHFLSRTDGHLLGRVQVGSDAIVSPLTSTNRGVLVQTGGGSLVLIGVN
jgi:outer membrane protein assembly factor BamB